ncbi:MAG: DUF4880 domain-containing protein [bacterium]
MKPSFAAIAGAAIERVLRGQATAAEERRLAAWRAADPANEQRAQEIERVLRLAWLDRPQGQSVAPTAADVIARGEASASSAASRRRRS